MQCPHCHSQVEVKPHTFALGEDQDGSWHVTSSRCNVCGRLIVELCSNDGCSLPVLPPTGARARLSGDVPREFESEYHAACRIIPFSPECAAAIGRRLLQRFLALHTAAGDMELGEQILLATRSPELQPFLRQALSLLAASSGLDPESPKSLRPNSLIPVEPGEAEWLLDVLQSLFEVHFVQPARLRRVQDALEEKVGPLAHQVAAEEPVAESPLAAGSEPDGGKVAATDDPDELPADDAPTKISIPLVPPPQS